jgi:hypothetical protein
MVKIFLNGNWDVRRGRFSLPERRLCKTSIESATQNYCFVATIWPYSVMHLVE